MSAPGVVVFSPSQYSLYSLAVVERFLGAGVEVRGICVRRLLSGQRLREEYRQEGSQLPRKIWKKMLRRGTRPPGTETSGSRNLRALARDHGIPVIFCQTLNDLDVLDHLEKHAASLVVFTGGGILRRPILERAGRGVLNCHLGFLPDYRGMDASWWAVLEGQPDKLGLSVHLMDEGIDTGPILSVRPLPLEITDTSFERLQERHESLMGEMMVETCLKFLRGEIQPQPQRAEEGKQYFRMHPRLREIAEKKLAPYVRSSVAPRDGGRRPRLRVS